MAFPGLGLGLGVLLLQRAIGYYARGAQEILGRLGLCQLSLEDIQGLSLRHTGGKRVPVRNRPVDKGVFEKITSGSLMLKFASGDGMLVCVCQPTQVQSQQG